jgi:hypothetical protein
MTYQHHVEPTGAFGEGRLLPLMPCDWCERTEDVTPQFDPWGCFDGRYLCERCIDAYHEGRGEDAFERGMCARYPVLTGSERW